jgi:hypothetical protein
MKSEGSWFHPVSARKFERSLSYGEKLGIVVPACHPRDNGKHKIGGLQVRLAWAKSETLSPK